MEKAFDMAKNILIDLIRSSLCTEGCLVSNEDVKAIMDNEETVTTRDTVYRIDNTGAAWMLMLSTIKTPIDNMYLEALHDICVDRVADVDADESIYDMAFTNMLGFLCRTTDPVLRALNLYCYLCETNAFPGANIRMALIIANKILIENNIGVLCIPTDSEDLREFHAALAKLHEDDDKPIMEFLEERALIRSEM